MSKIVCANCEKEINFNKLVIVPVVSPRDPSLIDNITIYSSDCLESCCYHHIHLDIDILTGKEITNPLEEIVIKYGLAEIEKEKQKKICHICRQEIVDNKYHRFTCDIPSIDIELYTHEGSCREEFCGSPSISIETEKNPK